MWWIFIDGLGKVLVQTEGTRRVTWSFFPPLVGTSTPQSPLENPSTLQGRFSGNEAKQDRQRGETAFLQLQGVGFFILYLLYWVVVHIT